MRSAAFFPATAARRAGTQLAIQASPWATEQECMLLQSFGVSQMKFVPALKADITSFEEPGSRLAHREAFAVIDVKERNGKWCSPRGGLTEQSVPIASATNAFHGTLVFAMISTIVGCLRIGMVQWP